MWNSEIKHSTLHGRMWTDEERIDRNVVDRMRLNGRQEQRRVISPRQWTIPAKKESQERLQQEIPRRQVVEIEREQLHAVDATWTKNLAYCSRFNRRVDSPGLEVNASYY